MKRNCNGEFAAGLARLLGVVLTAAFHWSLLPASFGETLLPVTRTDAYAAGEWDTQERAGRLSSAQGKYYVWADKGETIAIRMAISPKNHSANANIAVSWQVLPYENPSQLVAEGSATLTLENSGFGVEASTVDESGEKKSREQMVEALKNKIEFTAPESGFYYVHLETKGIVQVFMEDEFKERAYGVVAALPGEDRNETVFLPSWPNVPTYFYVPPGVPEITCILASPRNSPFTCKITNSSGTEIFSGTSIGEVKIKNPDTTNGRAYALRASTILRVAIPEALPFFARHPRNLVGVEKKTP